MQRSRVELEPDDGENDDRKQHEQPDLEQGGHRFDDGLEHDLQTLASQNVKRITFYSKKTTSAQYKKKS